MGASSDSASSSEMLGSDLGRGCCGAAYRSGETVAVADVRSEVRIVPFSRRALQAGLAAVFTCPLRHYGRRLGVLGLFGDRAATLSAADLGVVA
jgi:putative methionine-R-sulfoxide reductase with GAF domain